MGSLRRFSKYLKGQTYLEIRAESVRDGHVDRLVEEMGISRHTKKPSSGRPGSCKTTARTPRGGCVTPNRSTPVRTVTIRPLPLRATPAFKKHAQIAPPCKTHSRLTQTHKTARCCSPQPHEQHAAHRHPQGCTFYCYFCYCCYSCCLTLISFSLLLLLSPPPNDPSSDLISNATTSSSPLPQPSTSCLDEPSCFYPDVNLTTSLHCSASLYWISLPPFTTSSPDPISSSCSSSTPPSTPASPPHNSILCRPWPSTRSLSSLLLCPPSFGDPALSYASVLEHVPSGPARPRTLLRQQSLQQPLIHSSGPGLSHHPPTTSQSLGQLHTVPGQPGAGARRGEGGGSGVEGGGAGMRGGTRGARAGQAGAATSRCRGGGAGERSRANPGSWDYMMDQIKNRGLDVKSFL